MHRSQVKVVMFAILVLSIDGWLAGPKINGQEVTSMTHRPGSLIDIKARAMLASDEGSVRAVVDEIFNYPHVMGTMAAPLESEIKDRLVRSEMGYLNGTRSGVREEDIVSLFDMLAGKLNLPDYLRTSKKQVRALRMSMAISSPDFMGRGLADPTMKVGDSIRSEMSVLQAAHLAAVLLDQKFLDPHYQLPPEQWDREAHDQEVQRIQERQEMLKRTVTTKHQLTVGFNSNSRRMELHGAISRSMSSLGLQDSMDLIETALTILKVDR